MKNSSLYLRWIAANSLGEMAGLGLTFGIGYVINGLFGEGQGWAGALVSFLLMVATGAMEGSILGWAQWRAMHPWLPGLRRWRWTWATILGALAAWFLGALPFSIMNLANAAVTPQAAPPAEPPQWMVLLLAGGVGLLAGMVLAVFQARVLRVFSRRAGWWLPANALAWMAGMPIIFLVMDWVFRIEPAAGKAAGFLAALALTGAVVGAVHGLFLVWMVGKQQAAS